MAAEGCSGLGAPVPPHSPLKARPLALIAPHAGVAGVELQGCKSSWKGQIIISGKLTVVCVLVVGKLVHEYSVGTHNKFALD